MTARLKAFFNATANVLKNELTNWFELCTLVSYVLRILVCHVWPTEFSSTSAVIKMRRGRAHFAAFG